MTNRIKKTSETKPKKKKRGFVSKTINAMISGEFLTRKGVIKFMPFILFVTALFLTYIGIGYYFENTLREQVEVKKELEELTSRYNSVKSELEMRKQQSSVAEQIESLGLEEPNGQPNVIKVNKDLDEE